MFAPKRLLVPTDFSAYSDNALRHAIDIARQYGAEVFLLHVIDESIQQCTYEYCLTDDVMKQIEQESKIRSAEKLREEIERVEKNNADVAIEAIIKHGIPYEEILREQEDKKIDLIVIASHGRTGIKRVLIGSVAERVIRAAKCPVMLLRN